MPNTLFPTLSGLLGKNDTPAGHGPEHLAHFGLTEEERDKIPNKYFALPPDGFPCDTQEHLDAAATLLGKESAADQALIKKNARNIAEELGLKIPDSWNEGQMAASLSADDIRTALQGAISSRYPGADAWEPWVRDFYPTEGRVIFCVSGKTWQQMYEITDAGTVTLLDAPELVTQVTDYKPVEMAKMARTEDGDDVIYEGEIFRAGVYPKQKVKALPEHLMAVAEKIRRRARKIPFQPIKSETVAATGAMAMVAARDQHHLRSPFNAALKDYGLEEIEARDGGEWLWGRLRFPKWVTSALGDELPVSVGLALDGEYVDDIDEISLVDQGQVPTAIVSRKLAASFAAFAGAKHSKSDLALLQKVHDAASALGATCGEAGVACGDDQTAEMAGSRHSKADLADIQAMHDLAAKQGANCGAKMSSPAPHDPAQASSPKAKEKQMNPIQKALAFFRAKPEALAEAGLTEDGLKSLETAKFDEPLDPATLAAKAQFEAQFASQTAQLEAAKADFEAEIKIRNDKQLEQRAAEFAAQYTTPNTKGEIRLLPAQAGPTAELYKMAVSADGENGVAKFAAGGVLQEGEKVAQLKAYFDGLPVLPYFSTAIQSGSVGAPVDDIGRGPAAVDSASNLEALRAATPLGRATAKTKKGSASFAIDDPVLKLADALREVVAGGKS